MHYIFPLLAVLSWAGNTVITKMSASSIEPTEIGFYRWLLAWLLMTPFMLRPTLRNWWRIRPHLGKIFIMGTLGMAMFQSLMYFAAQYTTAANIGIIQALIPGISLVLALMLLRQRLTPAAIVGAATAFIGVLLVVSNGQLGQLVQQGLNRGDALMVGAVLSYALYSTLLKHWQVAISAMQMMYLQMLAAIIVQLPLFLLQPKTGLNMDNIPLVLYACLAASMIAPLAWMHGVRLMGPSRIAIFFNLMPILSLFIAALTLGEAIELYHWIGTAIILLGVFLAERWKGKPA
ncbi:DMT family transporter [Thiopseudomonas denitrificans]|uniref:Drug/metabolite transporter (DMT)-like permease n=1 Tax=Thiopseudomonas denitrificans TaxID=1501432 RepID=A0A4R6TVS3_9GAMM|nr:DMT family transporter [Thiopseudomonas denitrificans]TDQ37531.1 drug/metabolite transporter (DMT)-like permease [Thiopseudomonas denitrificans]